MFIHGSGCSWVWGGQNGPWDTMGTPWPAESWGSPLPASPWAAEVPSTPPPPPKDTLVLKASNQPKTVHGGVCVSPSAPRAVCSLALCSPHPSAHCNKKRFNSPPTPSRPPEHPIEEWEGGDHPQGPIELSSPILPRRQVHPQHPPALFHLPGGAGPHRGATGPCPGTEGGSEAGALGAAAAVVAGAAAGAAGAAGGAASPAAAAAAAVAVVAAAAAAAVGVGAQRAGGRGAGAVVGDGTLASAAKGKGN